jgi:hypothetical protein
MTTQSMRWEGTLEAVAQTADRTVLLAAALDPEDR